MNTHDTTDPSTLVPTGNTYDKYNTTNPIERRMMERFFTTLDRFIGTHATRAHPRGRSR